MASNSKPDQPTNKNQLSLEIRNMISTLTGHLTSLTKSTTAKSGGTSHQEIEEDDDGVRIITIAGSNKGATMEADMDEVVDTHGVLYGGDDQLSAITNSNYQAVNNSILVGGTCTAEDPGVHVVISDYMEDDGADEEEDEILKKEKKKEKEKGKA